MKNDHELDDFDGIHIDGNVSGSNINIGGSHIKQNIINKTDNQNIKLAFDIVFEKAQKIADKSLREDVIEILQKLQAEAAKGEKADEKRVRNWMNFLASMTPDIWDVAIRTFVNPIDGISSVFQKIAKRALNEKS